MNNTDSIELTFSNLLNIYMDELDCSAKTLASLSGLSETTISRYKQGTREPALDSKQLSLLSTAISSYANGKNGYDYNSIYNAFTNALMQKDFAFKTVVKNYNKLISSFNINMKTLANFTNFDVSFLYRVRQGQRKPNDLQTFINTFCGYMLQLTHNSSTHPIFNELFGCNIKDFKTEDELHHFLYNYILNDNDEDITLSDSNKPDITSFLKKMEEFDLDEYIRVIHFNDIKVPTVPIQLPLNKVYNDVEGMRAGELDFFKATVTSKNKEPIFMCNDMPMLDMADDMDFNKKWMFAIAAAIKKGFHINIIHNTNRPFEELMLGFEAWIPLYMTGQISPYQLKDYKPEVYHNLTYVSGVAALHGECIKDFHNNGRYILSNSKADLKYYRQKADDLIYHATPLMDIYNNTQVKEMENFIYNSHNTIGERRYLLYLPPIFTISDSLLSDILHNNISDSSEKVATIKKYVQRQKELFTKIVNSNPVNIEMPIFSKDEFDKYTVCLSFFKNICPCDIRYTYEQYLKHIDETKDYCNKHNITLSINDYCPFRNIQIYTVNDKYIVITKDKSPSIIFVIKHKMMINAMMSFDTARYD